MTRGKTIQVYLIDGDPAQRIKCKLQNWTGIVYKIPRTMLNECKNGNIDIVKHLKQSGIYFLLGKNVKTSTQMVYIGQAIVRKNGEGVLSRIQEHERNNRERYWNDWNEVIVLTTQNDSFGATELNYLENQFTTLVKQGSYHLLNGNEPNLGNITEEKESELSEYIDYAKMIVGVLGHSVFVPHLTKEQQNVSLNSRITSEEAKESDFNVKSPIFYWKGKLKATGVLTTKGFVVLKGSIVNCIVKGSMPKAAMVARKKYADQIDENNKLISDILFSSPSSAAGFVGGSSLSGNVCWRTEDGKTPKDF